MRKVSWTKRFAAGWGERRACEWRSWGGEGGWMSIGRRIEREIARDAHSIREAASSLAGKHGARVSRIGVSGYLPVRVTARRNGDIRRATASGNCHSGDIAVAPRRGPPPRRELDRSVPSAGSTPRRGLPSSAAGRCRPASPGSRAPRHGWTGLASRGARARSIGPCETLAAGRAGGSAGGTQRPAAARCATPSALRSFQRKVTWVWSMSRIRALLIAVRKTYRDR